MENCVIYARYSSTNQNEASIDAQLRACNAYAKAKGYIVINNYIDKALSGTTDNRPSFQEMLAEAHNKQFTIVLVHKFDRFARDTLTHDIAKNALALCGCRIESVLEPLSDTPESIISESLYKGMAEYYSKNLAREVKKGRNERIKQIEANGKAKHLGGFVRYGYSLAADKTYIIIPDEAAVIRLIYDLFGKGLGYRAIQNELILKNLHTRNGTIFTLDQIRRVLTYEPYTGVFINHINPTNLLYKKHRAIIEKQYKEIRIDGAMPQIVPKEAFIMAKERISKNQNTGRVLRAKEPYLLSGLVKCGNCGHTMVGNNNGNASAYYVCPTYKRGRGCSMTNIKRDEIETVVLDYLTSNFNDTLIDSLIDLLDRKKSEYKAGANSRRLELEKSLLAINKRIDAVVNEMIEVASSPALRTKLVQFETEKAQIEAELATGDDMEISGDLTREQISQYVNAIAHIKEKSRQQQQRIVQSIISEIKVYNNVDESEISLDDIKYYANKRRNAGLIKVEITSIFGVKFGLLGCTPRKRQTPI